MHEPLLAMGLMALTLAAAMMPGRGQGAQVAASIAYETVPRPDGLPGDFQAPAGTRLEFLAITAIDGSRVDAALWQPAGKAPADATLVIAVHGSGGNYASAPSGFVGSGLAQKGYAVLAINTRGHDKHVNTENFLDVSRDLGAAVATGRALGFTRLVLYGHSLGNIHVLYYAATNWDADIKAVALSGMFANLPWKTRDILVQNDDSFKSLSAEAVAAQRAGKDDAILATRMGFTTGQKVPVSARHFLTYRWDRTSVADGTYWIGRIPKPILMVRDQSDGVIEPFEPFWLLSAAQSEGSLVPSIKYVLVPDDHPRSLEGHLFVYRPQQLVDTLAGWLAEQRL
jgi:pimeloyl-ACP methyl ester carboxylesterase